MGFGSRDKMPLLVTLKIRAFDRVVWRDVLDYGRRLVTATDQVLPAIAAPIGLRESVESHYGVYFRFALAHILARRHEVSL